MKVYRYEHFYTVVQPCTEMRATSRNNNTADNWFFFVLL